MIRTNKKSLTFVFIFYGATTLLNRSNVHNGKFPEVVEMNFRTYLIKYIYYERTI